MTAFVLFMSFFTTSGTRWEIHALGEGNSQGFVFTRIPKEGAPVSFFARDFWWAEVWGQPCIRFTDPVCLPEGYTGHTGPLTSVYAHTDASWEYVRDGQGEGRDLRCAINASAPVVHAPAAKVPAKAQFAGPHWGPNARL